MIIPQGALSNFEFNKTYQNIVSLVPSISWLLFDLQLQEHIRGITKFCKAANNQQIKYPKIGGTKNPDIHKINGLHADLIVANKEENRKEDIEALSSNHVVYLSDITDLKSMNQMISEISILTDRQELGLDFITQIKSKENLFHNSFDRNSEISVAYLIWKDPYMTIGADTFIHFMLDFAGFKNSFGYLKRYPAISLEDLKLRKPDFILLSSEPYSFNAKHLEEFNPLKAKLVDGRIFSWYGTFILQSFEYLDAFKKSLNSNL